MTRGTEVGVWMEARRVSGGERDGWTQHPHLGLG